MKIEVVSEIPDFTVRGGRWRELHDAAEKIEVGQVIRVTVDNKGEAKSAQGSLQGSHGTGRGKSRLKDKGYRFATRSRPVNGKADGEWYLFIKRLA